MPVQNSGPGVAVSLVLHALAGVALAKIAWTIPGPPAPAPASIVWLGEWSHAPIEGSQRGRDEVDSEPGAGSRSPEEEAPTALPNGGAPPASAADDAPPDGAQATRLPQPQPTSPPPVDWAAARKRAIEDAVAESERGASYRSFSFPGTIAEEEEVVEAERQARTERALQPPKTAFDSPSKGRAGLADSTPFGQYVVWITDDCYQTWGTSNPFLVAGAAALFAAPATTCVPGQPRADLFENLKPSYLMSLEERDDRTERLRRADRLGRTETGAVALFGN